MFDLPVCLSVGGLVGRMFVDVVVRKIGRVWQQACIFGVGAILIRHARNLMHSGTLVYVVHCVCSN